LEERNMVYKKKIKIVIKWSPIVRWQASNDGKVPEVPGVYELLVKQNDDKYARRYVGQGDDLRERFQAHLSPEEENECIRERLAKYVCGFDYAVIAHRDERLDAERALYDKYRTHLHCNKVRPSGSGKDYDVEIVEE
jgi:hypothetical protein